MSDLKAIREIAVKVDTSFKRVYRDRVNDHLFFRDQGYYVLNSDGRVEEFCLVDSHFNSLDVIVNHLLSFEALKTLRVRNGNLTDISLIERFSQLEALDLSGNKLINVSDIQFPETLIELNLSRNKLEEIQFSSSLNNLRELDISGNQIYKVKKLPASKSLCHFDISFNKLSKLEFISDLIELQTLNVTSNPIDNIDHVTNLKKLERLFAHNNAISDLSPLKNISSLKGIYICQSRLDDISPLKRLTQIDTLYLNNNNIRRISALKELAKLKYLSLTGNRITDISSIRALKELSAVALGSNPIAMLPSWITELGLKVKIVQGKEHDDYLAGSEELVFDTRNPIRSPPIEILKQGNDAIRRYFKKVKKEGTDFIYEAKLTLVGEGSSGKTSLLSRLLNVKKPLPKKDTRTRGIQIHDWEFKHKHLAHIWDFGGQDVYYPVHRFFLTENSVFVLLASTRQTYHNFDYWIPTIYQFGGESPIVLGQTCHDGNKMPWNDLGYYLSNFNIIKTQTLPYHELNLPNKNEGLSKIKRTIIDQILNLPHYGKGVPRSWIPVRSEIYKESRKRACMTFEEFKQLCRNSDGMSFNNLLDIEDCAKFLHSIGVILWYYDNDMLRSWVIMQPEWAMNAVYKIIDDGEIQKRRGHIRSSDFTRLWRDQCYEDRHTILKTMLQVFKIAFPKKHRQEDFIIPARLLSMPDDKRFECSMGNFLALEYHYEFMAKGMVNQLSAELSRFIASDDEVWNNAVNFKNHDNTASCQVEEDFYRRKIFIRAIGVDARGLVMIVMNALNDVTEGYRGVRPKIYVPCTCAICIAGKGNTNFLYDDLLRWMGKKPNSRVTCNESGESLLIDFLLFNVGLAVQKEVGEERMQQRISSKKMPLKIFVSYSKYDEAYLQEFQDHLVTLKQEGLTSFDCRQIELGAEWDKKIKDELQASDVIVCLVSVKFLNTDYITKIEIPQAIALNKLIVPIIIRSCDWENSQLGKFQAAQRGKIVSLNNDKKLRGEIEALGPEERDAFWTAIIKEFRKKIIDRSGNI